MAAEASAARSCRPPPRLTRTDLVDRLVASVRERHPYDLPNITAVPVTAGNPDLIAWITNETPRALVSELAPSPRNTPPTDRLREKQRPAGAALVLSRRRSV
jgi:CutA1 divalent ion tolerance protein